MITLADLKQKENHTYVIAEVAQSHDGSIGLAHSFIDEISRCGADAVKFQTHFADEESTYDEPWRVKFSHQDKTRFDYWRRMEFSREEWFELASHAQAKGLDFLSSPFSNAAVELLREIGQKFWKVGSGEIYNEPLISDIIQDEIPILFSSGMSSIKDLEEVINLAKEKNKKFAILQCTSMYPCPPEYWGIENILELKSKFNCPVGYSDHSGSIFPSIAARTLGASFIEVHVTFSKSMFGPDVSSSIDFNELKNLIRGIRMLDESFENSKQKDQNITQSKSILKNFSRSVALKKDLPKGAKITLDDLTMKKPGGGFTYSKMKNIIGKRLKHDKSKRRILSKEDFE